MLSKGHAVAALASIYAELGYFDRSVLRNSRSYHSILNGHPGPLLPGVHLATGPMGQGLGVAQGFAIAGRMAPRFDVYCLTGDGELQEGPIWEAVMYAGQKHLDNLCVMVDRNNGQLDIANRMVFPMPELERVFASFDWQVHSVDATQYDGVYAALEQFRFGPRNGKPTAIICHGTKGHGALSDFLNKHKVTVPGRADRAGIPLQAARRERARRGVPPVPSGPGRSAERRGAAGDAARHGAVDAARTGPRCRWRRSSLSQIVGPVVTRRAPPRDKRIAYDAALLPKLDPNEAVRRQRRRDGGDESVRARSARRLDRRRPGDDERPRSRRGRGRSAPRAERRRRRSQHDGASARRSRRSAIRPGSARSVRSSTGR